MHFLPKIKEKKGLYFTWKIAFILEIIETTSLKFALDVVILNE